MFFGFKYTNGRYTTSGAKGREAVCGHVVAFKTEAAREEWAVGWSTSDPGVGRLKCPAPPPMGHAFAGAHPSDEWSEDELVIAPQSDEEFYTGASATSVFQRALSAHLRPGVTAAMVLRIWRRGAVRWTVGVAMAQGGGYSVQTCDGVELTDLECDPIIHPTVGEAMKATDAWMWRRGMTPAYSDQCTASGHWSWGASASAHLNITEAAMHEKSPADVWSIVNRAENRAEKAALLSAANERIGI